MTLDEFVTEQIEDLKAFQTFWKEQHRKDPERYPNTLYSGDWDEQFTIWES